MLKVNVKNGNIDKALKILKRKTRNVKQIVELRDNKEYTKPSEVNREKKKKAIYVEKKKNEEDNV
tara:strand:+ start:15196 stop:15390 length:195 start_codon:yes stop_codon:yes gene_type:complete